MDSGPERIGDEGELRVVRKQAARVHAKAAVLIVALTALAWLWP